MIIFQSLNRLVIPSRLEYVDNIISKVVSEINNLYLKVSEYENDALDSLSSIGFGLSLSIDEALKNAIEHGNKNDPEKHVQMEYYIDSGKIQIKVKDQGGGFPHDVLSRNNSDPDSERGRGLMLIRNFMDQVQWNESGNEIIMIKFRKNISGGK